MSETAVRALWILVLLLVPIDSVLAEKYPPNAELPRTVFWGVHRDCDDYDVDVSKAVENRLLTMGGQLISVPTIAAALPARYPGCIGEDCTAPVEAVCPGSNAYFVGAVITQRYLAPAGGEAGKWYQIRVWRIQAGSKKAAYIQSVCRNCNLTVVVPSLVAEIVEYPPNELMSAAEVRAAKMPFCMADNNEESPLPREQRVSVLISGLKEKAGKALLRALKEHVAQTGRDVVRGEVLKGGDEQNPPPPPELSQFIAKKTVNDVLSVEMQAEGQVRVRLMNGSTLTTAERTFDCLGCNAEALERRSIMAVGALLDRCTEKGCRAEVSSTPMRWPDGLCQASRGPVCSESDVASETPPAAPAVDAVCKALTGGCIINPPSPPSLPPSSPRPPRLGTGRIVGASLLGAAGVGAIITAGVLTAFSGQPAGDGCTSQNKLLMGDCSYPILTAGYVPTYVAGALLLGGAVFTLRPLFKKQPAPSKQKEASNKEVKLCP